MGQIRDQALIKKIALTLKAIRHEKGVSLEEVYNETDIHLARIETGKLNISISTLSRLCIYFNLSLAEFFKRVEK